MADEDKKILEIFGEDKGVSDLSIEQQIDDQINAAKREIAEKRDQNREQREKKTNDFILFRPFIWFFSLIFGSSADKEAEKRNKDISKLQDLLDNLEFKQNNRSQYDSLLPPVEPVYEQVRGKGEERIYETPLAVRGGKGPADREKPEEPIYAEVKEVFGQKIEKPEEPIYQNIKQANGKTGELTDVPNYGAGVLTNPNQYDLTHEQKIRLMGKPQEPIYQEIDQFSPQEPDYQNLQTQPKSSQEGFYDSFVDSIAQAKTQDPLYQTNESRIDNNPLYQTTEPIYESIDPIYSKVDKSRANQRENNGFYSAIGSNTTDEPEYQTIDEIFSPKENNGFYSINQQGEEPIYEKIDDVYQKGGNNGITYDVARNESQNSLKIKGTEIGESTTDEPLYHLAKKVNLTDSLLRQESSTDDLKENRGTRWQDSVRRNSVRGADSSKENDGGRS